MPLSGTGIYAAPSSSFNPAVGSTTISSTDWNALLADLTAALSTAMYKDGQATPTADVPMGGFKITDMADGAAADDAATVAQLRNTTDWAVAGGTADAITANYTPAVTAVVDGLLLAFRASAANTISAPTFAPDGLTARTITRLGGSTLVPGDIRGALAEVFLRFNLANTRWELINPQGDVGWNLITAQTAAAVTHIDITAGLTDAYDKFMICFDQLKPSIDDVYLGFRIGTGVGPTYQSAPGAYAWGSRVYGLSAGSDDGSSIAPSDGTLIALSRTAAAQGVGNASGEHITGVIEFSNPELTDYPTFKTRSVYVRNDALPQGMDGMGFYGATTAITGIRFLFSNGNINSGTFRLYGLRK